MSAEVFGEVAAHSQPFRAAVEGAGPFLDPVVLWREERLTILTLLLVMSIIGVLG